MSTSNRINNVDTVEKIGMSLRELVEAHERQYKKDFEKASKAIYKINEIRINEDNSFIKWFIENKIKRPNKR